VKKISYGVALAVVFFLGLFIANWYSARNAVSESKSESVVLLEKVRKVMKLVTIEGEYNETYDERNIKKVTLYLPFPTVWGFSKKAMMQVKGKVLVGYDMQQIKITADSLNRIITLSNLPEPEILAIDADVAFKNISESYFNSFTPEDYTQLNKNAKNALREKAIEEALLNRAAEQGNQLVEVVRYMTNAVGWQLQIDSTRQKFPG